jgi:hypothetical protein
MTNTDHLSTALGKLDEATSKTVHLTPREARAVLTYIQQHGMRADIVAKYWRGDGRRRKTLSPHHGG